MAHNTITIDSQTLKKLCARQDSMLKMFLHLLLHVGSTPPRIKDVLLNDGELLVSRRTLANKLGVNEGEIRLMLDQLITLNLIEVSPRKRYTIVTINNYASYIQSRQDTKKAGKKSADNIIPALPTLAEITEYCRSRGNSVDATYFFDYYQSVGWKVGRNQMKDWQAAVRTWEKRSKPANSAVKHSQQKKYERF